MALPGTLEMMRQLIRNPSISSTDPNFDQGNLAVVECLADWLESLGFALDLQPIGAQKANLVARLGGHGEPDGLVLSGHTDTVPFDQGAWSVDPFAGIVRDGKLYGLGSADMKSFFALAIEAARRFRAHDLRHSLVIVATADEESSMSGARTLFARGRSLGRYCLIGEPTGLQPIRLHKGVLMEAIEIHGQAGHSSDPALGANAIEGMQLVLTELLRWREELQAAHRNPAFHVPVPTLNFGSIHGGDNPNRICAHCALHIDLRPLPGMDLIALRNALRERLHEALAAHPRLRGELHSLFDGLPPFETPADAVLVRTCEALTGRPAAAVAFGTEAPLLAQLGLETVVLGPGHIAQAHQADEYLPLAHAEPYVDLLSRLIERFCVQPPST